MKALKDLKKDEFIKLEQSGLLWEIYPEASSTWEATMADISNNALWAKDQLKALEDGLATTPLGNLTGYLSNLGTCPHCGYCPTCGRRYSDPFYWHPWNITCNSGTSLPGNVQ